MKAQYGTYFYTRDNDRDYQWHKRPEYMPADFYYYFPELVMVREHLQEADIDFSQIFFLTKQGDVNIACRILTDIGEDYVGRPIYSLEGVAQEAKGKRADYGIPDLLNKLYQDTTGYAFLETQGTVAQDFTVEDTINPLLYVWEKGGLDSEENEESKALMENPAFQRLVTDVGLGKTGYSLVVGPGAEQVFQTMKMTGLARGLGCESYYDFKEIEKLSDRNTESDREDALKEGPLEGELQLSCCNLGTAQWEKQEMKIYIRFWREGKEGGSYIWMVGNRKKGTLMKSERRKFTHRISMKKLVSEAARIRNYYTSLGYQIQ